LAPALNTKLFKFLLVFKFPNKLKCFPPNSKSPPSRWNLSSPSLRPPSQNQYLLWKGNYIEYSSETVALKSSASFTFALYFQVELLVVFPENLSVSKVSQQKSSDRTVFLKSRLVKTVFLML